MQTTWLTFVRASDSIAEPRAVAGWLCTAARREAWRVSRQSTRQRPTEDETIARRLPDEPAPEGQVVLDDSNARLWACLRPAPRALPEAAAHRRGRGPTRLRRRLRAARDAGGQHRPHARPLPRQAAPRARAGRSDLMTEHTPSTGPTTPSSSPPPRGVWELIDPPPADLAEGVLARLAAEDLELELLTLVESDGLAGVRHAAPDDRGARRHRQLAAGVRGPRRPHLPAAEPGRGGHPHRRVRRPGRADDRAAGQRDGRRGAGRPTSTSTAGSPSPRTEPGLSRVVFTTPRRPSARHPAVLDLRCP